MRISSLAGLAALLFSTAASSGVGPEIAIAKQVSNASEIDLINPDGTGFAVLYRSPQKKTLNSLDLRPGGGEIAFTLSYQLKILQFDDRGVAVGSPRAIPTACPVLALDYHPTNGSLLFTSKCSGAGAKVYRLQSGASMPDPTPLLTDPVTFGVVRWSADGTKIYHLDSATTGMFAFNVGTGQTDVVQSAEIGDLNDVTRTGDRLIQTTSPSGTYYIYDVANHTTTSGFCRGAALIRFGASDTKMLFRIPAGQTGYYVMVQNSDCSGSASQLTGSGAYNAIDWRAP